MSTFDKKIAQLCPNGVPFKPLGGIGKLIRGRRFTKADYVDEGIGSIHYGEIYTHFGTWATNVRSHVRSDLKDTLRLAGPGDLVIAATSENVDEVGKAVAWLGVDDVAVHDDCYIFRHDLDPKFVAYFFQSKIFHEQKVRLLTNSKLVRISAQSLARIVMPVPPLAIQRQVASILDIMESLNVELTSELAARRLQYSYYADSLLDSDPNVPRVKFGEIATIQRGASPRPIRSFICPPEDGEPWIKIGDVPPDGKYITHTAQHLTRAGASKSRRVRPGDFILSNSMSFGRPYISKINGYIHDGWLAISNFERTYIPDYLYYLLRSAPVQLEFARRAGSGTVQNLNAEIVKSIRLPLPPVDRQCQVVAQLNLFDALVNDKGIGLPAELLSRRQQYEYYLDRLLTFPELV